MDRNVIFRAGWALMPNGELIADAAIRCEGTRIASVGRFSSDNVVRDAKVFDFRNHVVLPGLINAHTHLELTYILGKIQPTNDFIKWIKKVIRLRKKASLDELRESSELGVDSCIQSGTTTVVDIAATDASIEPLKNAPIRKIVLPELISIDPDDAKNAFTKLLQRLKAIRQDDLLSVGIAPHAPYTISAELYKLTAKYSRDNGMPLSTHLCETREEIEFLRDADSKMGRFLKWRKLFPLSWEPPMAAPAKYLSSMNALGDNTLLIHFNYPSDEEIEIVKKSRSSVVFCPGSHRFFKHEPYPLVKLLDAGINVCIGTDSLASNWTLSILDELRVIRRDFPDIPAKQLINLATQNAACAIGTENELGRLAPNYLCDLTILKVPRSQNITSLDPILDNDEFQPVGIVVGGTFIPNRLPS